MADNEWDNFESVDVSKPVKVRKESELLAERKAMYRREWIRSHMTHIFVIIGILAVVLVFILIYVYNKDSSPVNRLMSSSSKDFSAPFDFSVEVTQDEKTVMSFKGSADINCNAHSAKVIYDADYNDYSYKAAVYADDNIAVNGFYYKDKWTVRDCSSRIGNFFDFAADFRAGKFDAGAFLRFTELTSEYSAYELNKFVPTVKDKLGADSALAVVTFEKDGDDTKYHYDINTEEAFKLIINSGASIFSSADSYNAFKERFELNEKTVSEADFDVYYTIDSQGFLTDFSLNISFPGHSYGLNCKMDNFYKAEANVPADFIEEATVAPSEN